ncbi:MAG: DegT/DnrJ/EryC1/StrS family aminotransferase [Patescibacteria group bacterium]
MIPFVDFRREYRAIRKEIDEAIKRVLNRGRFILGPEVENFEKNFARYCGVKYCVGVNSGTDALYLSLLAAGIGGGDEVIVPVNTALPTAMAVAMSGARPVFVDCDSSSLIDIAKIPNSITKKTKAIIPVHLYGMACDMTRLCKISKDYRLVLIEDCAQATGARWRGKRVGAWGDFGCFSFYPTKNLGAYGDGGMIATGNKDFYKKLLAARFYGQRDRATCSTLGVNSRLDELQAAILNAKLKYLDKWNKKRTEIADLYRRLIKNPATILPLAQSAHKHVYHLFVIRTKRRGALIKILAERGIQTMIHYPNLLHRQPFFKESKSRSFPNAQIFNREILSLPLYPFLKKSEVENIARIINHTKL